MQKILLVEDNQAICMGLEFLIKGESYDCCIANNCGEADAYIERSEEARHTERAEADDVIDLVLLDVSLPDGNGFELCKRIKEETQIPVIFLTARDQESDVVLGFDLGADDYVIKPFRNRELVSRIKNILRRNSKSECLSCGHVEIDTVAGKVRCNKEEVQLTKLEYKILLIIFSNPNKLFTREEILSEIWDLAGKFVNDNTLTVYIKRIREKIGDKDGHIIETVRGMGYRLGDGK